MSRAVGINPGRDALQEYIDRTETLLAELHLVLSIPMFSLIRSENGDSQLISDQISAGAAFREPIFYGGESAYGFQYCDLARQKCEGDDAWLMANKGFKIADACAVITAITSLQNKKTKIVHDYIRSTPTDNWTILPGLKFTAREVADFSDIHIDLVNCVLKAFAFPRCEVNAEFTSLHAYNALNGTPLLMTDVDEYVLWHQYSLFEAIYESPFFWITADEDYRPTALRNRGKFTEAYAFNRLEKVFGKVHVYQNVQIRQSKAKDLGEIDVLVIFGNRAIVLQAKSKRLTLEARRGNDSQIKDDFKKAIQQSYDQAYLCANALTGADVKLLDARGRQVLVPSSIRYIYPICIVADHYPALSFQSREFLKVCEHEKITAPLITDVFALDMMTEMLESPLRLLSYLDLRARFGELLLSSHERVLLSFHLKENLWLNGKFDQIALEDDIATDLDIAMLARREGLPGKDTPEGTFSRLTNTELGRIIALIEKSPNSGTIELGLLLLELPEELTVGLNRGIRRIIAETRLDGRLHDFTVELMEHSAGLTIHCSTASLATAHEYLRLHCNVRKYSQKAKRWFGLAVTTDGTPQFGVNLESDWKYDPEMERGLNLWPKGTAVPLSQIGTRSARRIGRNEPCSCGSGKKYKRCCMQS